MPETLLEIVQADTTAVLENTAKALGELVVPAHGRGRIWRGAPANPVPGTGRPPSALREQLRRAAEDRVSILEDFADGRVRVVIQEKCPKCGHEPAEKIEEVKDMVPSVADRRGAIGDMLRYGLGDRTEITTVSEEVQHRLMRQAEVITAEFEPDLATKILDLLDPVWQ